MSRRESGFYWVKVNVRRDWVIARWDDGFWSVPTLGYLACDTRLYEIDERRIVRSKVSQ